ncbi:hypothetical protein GCM10023067_60070 [Aminobacter aganoensis]
MIVSRVAVVMIVLAVRTMHVSGVVVARMIIPRASMVMIVLAVRIMHVSGVVVVRMIVHRVIVGMIVFAVATLCQSHRHRFLGRADPGCLIA